MIPSRNEFGLSLEMYARFLPLQWEILTTCRRYYFRPLFSNEPPLENGFKWPTVRSTRFLSSDFRPFDVRFIAFFLLNS